MNNSPHWGPWPNAQSIEANRPTEIHQTPSGQEAAATAIRQNDNPLADDPQALTTYGINELLAVLAIHTKQLADDKRGHIPFRVDVRNYPHAVLNTPHGIVKSIVNNSGVAVAVTLAEEPSADPIVRYAGGFLLPPGITYCYLPFSRRLFCTMCSAYPVAICGETY